MANGDAIDRFKCNCPRPYTEHMPEHASWCRSRLPRPPVARDPARMLPTEAMRQLTGYEGIPDAIGVDEPLTHRVGDYLGQPRDQAPQWAGSVEGVPLSDAAATALGTRMMDAMRAADWILITPEEQALIAAIRQGSTGGQMRKAIDRYAASLYDSWIDELEAKKREHTQRLVK